MSSDICTKVMVMVMVMGGLSSDNCAVVGRRIVLSDIWVVLQDGSLWRR